MKRYIWIGVAMLALALVAAQCNSLTQSPTENDRPVQEPAAQEPAAETASQKPTKTPAPTAEAGPVEKNEEEVAEEPETAGETEMAEVTEEVATNNDETEESVTTGETVAKNDTESAETAGEETHSQAGCEDPFAGVERMRFSPDIWTAEGVARFVKPGLVDADSGLETNFCKHSAGYAEILSGGPPPDGIPPIDDPTFDSLAVGDEWLADVQPVIALAVGKEARAYPLAILTRHEIVNDEIDGAPVAVTFCPLCNAAIVFKREVDGEVLRFGVSGNLRNSDLIMWDNKTLSWWQQFTGEAIVGDMTGTQLEMIPAQLVAWKDFKAAYPEGTVLSNNGRPYGQNPYVGYDSSARPFLYLGDPDPRLPATERVLGYFRDDTAVAYPLPVIQEELIIEDTLNGQDVVIFYEPGQVSALDQSSIEDSKQVGSAGMFIPEVDGQTLTFKMEDDKIVDNETGSQWNVFGQALSGELAGAELQPVLSHMHFWFAWAAFRPDTEVYGS